MTPGASGQRDIFLPFNPLPAALADPSFACHDACTQPFFRH